jgi:hypothetical protein
MPYTGPERQRTRAWWHDYRRPRAYFVTLTCHQQACLWGRIVDGKLLPSAGGEIVSAALAGRPLLRARHLRSVDAGRRVARTSTEILTGTQSSLFIGSVPVYGFPQGDG